jgi:very-short-patch-repair endonuclease
MTKIVFYNKPTCIKTFVRALRKNMTTAEENIWKRVRNKQLYWLKIHRQKAIWIERQWKETDRFIIADFYHHPTKTIIEIDGDIHLRDDVQARDILKESLLHDLWYTILRYTNNEVFDNIEGVLEDIYERITALSWWEWCVITPPPLK